MHSHFPTPETLRFTQCWARGSCAQPFPYICTYCHVYKCSVTHLSGSCTPASGIWNNGVCCVVKIAVADSKPAKDLLARHSKHLASAPMFWLETVTTVLVAFDGSSVSVC